MFILGLTGSIGMGKSETSKMFRRLGVPVFDADATVHELLNKGGRAVQIIESAFPGVTKDGSIDRAVLGARVFNNKKELRKLEVILHPMVAQMQRIFVNKAMKRRLPLVVLDIPLLFEGHGEKRCDAAVLASAPHFIQRQRVLTRSNMDEKKFEHIQRQQLPDMLKRQRADFILPTGLGRRFTMNRVAKIILNIRGRTGHAWPPRGRPNRRSSNHPSRRPVHARNRIRH